MIAPKDTKSVTISGTYYVTLVTNKLLDRSAWFCVEPMPDNQWIIYFKPEQKEAVKKVVRSFTCKGGRG